MESSRLEALPPEMKYAILFTIPDLASLNALVHASPIFHTLYLSRRKQLLSTVLNRCLQLPVMVEAVAALIALRGLEERRKNYRPFGILQFLYTYIPLRSNLDPTSSPSDTWSMYHEQDMDVYDIFTTFTENDPIEMARLHTIVEYISEDMVCYFLKAIPGPQQQERSITRSPSESFRLQRTIYRLDILRLLCEWTYFKRKPPEFKECGQEFYYGFLCIFSPWEMEELKCFQEYVFHHYEELPGASYSEDDRDSILLKNELSSYTCEDAISNGDRESFMLFGVGYLYRWIHISRISCAEERLAEQISMTRGRRGYLSGPMLYAFEEYPDREHHLDYGDEGTSGRIFVSDEDWNSPNLAWTWCLDPDTPDASIEYFTSAWDCTLRTWGYIFLGQRLARGMGYWPADCEGEGQGHLGIHKRDA
ncbi:hypothetical protein RU639_004016 [Aspergillus parasiticus]